MSALLAMAMQLPTEPPSEALHRALLQRTQVETIAVVLKGLTLWQIETMAIHASFRRHRGNRRKMMLELGLTKKTLLRRLTQLELRRLGPLHAVKKKLPNKQPTARLSEPDVATLGFRYKNETKP